MKDRPLPERLKSETLPAGDFDEWMTHVLHALEGKRSSDVPCGECTACCTSSQFVYIGADEKQTLSRIPAALLFDAPGRGGFVLGYNEKGHCPMLSGNKCSIYNDRPLTCRVYDCRVFTAASVSPGKKDRPAIHDRTQQWQFGFSSEVSRKRRNAVEEAANFLQENPALFENRPLPPTQLAVLAVRIHHLFMAQSRDQTQSHAAPSIDAVRRQMDRLRAGKKEPRL